LRSIRNGQDANTVLNRYRTGSLLLQMAVSPETRFRYEFPYRSEMPEYMAIENPYLDSMIYESQRFTTRQQPTTISLQQGYRSVAGQYHSQCLKPFHAATVVDPSLSKARPSLWTNVCCDDTLMRDLLSVFFRCEYQFTAAFQKDLFLQDMIAQQRDFCSSLLVNIVLAYSCVRVPRAASAPKLD
jgi:hypothetical protein